MPGLFLRINRIKKINIQNKFINIIKNYYYSKLINNTSISPYITNIIIDMH